MEKKIFFLKLGTMEPRNWLKKNKTKQSGKTSLRKRKDSEGPKILSLTQVTATQESEMWEVGGR